MYRKLLYNDDCILNTISNIVIFDFEEELLSIFSREILEKIKNKEKGWEAELPNGIAEMIRNEKMFGFGD